MKLTALAATALDIDPAALSAEGGVAPDWDEARHIDLLLAVEVAYDVQFAIGEIRAMRTLDDMRASLVEKGALPLAA